MNNGLYFEDFLIGNKYITLRRTITESDHVNSTTQFGFFEPLFIDREYVSSKTEYQKQVVPGALTFSMAEGLTILTGILHDTGMAFLGVDLKVLKPVFIGDTIRVEFKVTAKRETSKPDRGIVTYEHRVINQHNEPVMQYQIKRMIRRRPETQR